jgi:hypothetical protein
VRRTSVHCPSFPDLDRRRRWMCRPESKRRWYGTEGEKSQMWVVVSGRGALPWTGRRDQPLHLKTAVRALIHHDFSIIVGCQQLHVRFTLGTRLCQWNRHWVASCPGPVHLAGDLCFTYARLLGGVAVENGRRPGGFTARAPGHGAARSEGRGGPPEPAGYLRIPNCSARFSTAVQSSSLKNVSM